MKSNERQVGGEHYLKQEIQPWDAIVAWGLGFLSGNIVKYIARYPESQSIQDLHKAKHYLEKLIEVEEIANANRQLGKDT